MSEPTKTHDFVIVANRLPVESTDQGWRDSPGGLVRALVGLLRERSGVWVGWAGVVDDDTPSVVDDDTPSFEHDGLSLEPISLDAGQVAGYYESVSNAALWPLYHDAIRTSVYDADSWVSYRAVNRAFAERTAAVAAPGATVWVHDYHLQLVPGLLREMRPDLRIGFFLHIPFPPQELFMRLPWRDEVIEGLLGADVIGFQRTVAAENFIGLANRLLGLETDGLTIRAGDGRTVEVGSFPISIDLAEFEALACDEATVEEAHAIRTRLGNPAVVMLGVDRLDYTKGISERLVAFQSLLTARRCDDRVVRPPVVLVQVAVPSRETVGDYQSQREHVEQLVGAINGEFATLGHPAVHYLHQSLPLPELVALYRAADVMVVTPLRDGMNLVAKEFVASRPDESGVLVLSEFAGAVDELRDAVIVNPHDPEALVESLATAIAMDDAEARRRMRSLRAAVSANDVHSWATAFLGRLADHHAARDSTTVADGVR
ncbi:MAG: trehalose-6-phosphate synthase [Actinobacteria bacterium]|nr:trehalose-6-phosphate synthase [Actinomycetota bacterium]